jgi:hypothetical protein
MKYLIQIFRPTTEDWKTQPYVGTWNNINTEGLDREKALATADSIMATGKFAGVRVLELILEKTYDPQSQQP